jgi:hypothetical protein
MRPPECDICGKAAEELVRFAPRDSDRAWRQLSDADRGAGHPPDSAWLCEFHAARARALPSTTTIDQGRKTLKAPPRRRPTPAPPPTPEVSNGATPLIPIEIGQFERQLRDVFTVTAEAMGMTDARPTTVDDRRWMPMDGAEAPDCPFVDESVREAHDPTRSLTLRFERSHWNSDQIARASVTLAGYQAQGQSEFRITAHTPASGDSLLVDEVTVTGEIPSPVRETLEALGRS